MKRKELIELRGKSSEDLLKLVAQKKLEARKANVKSEKGLKGLRRTIAQILTIIGEKKIEEKLNTK
jgi:ribosomal protein L29